MAKNQTYPFARSTANQQFPYDPIAGTGDPDDDMQYMARPGVQFFLPWLSTPGGPSFIWPLGLQGWDLSIDPQLGIHKYIGDNKVEVSVLHRGEETFTLTGNFFGESAPDSFRKLRDVVYAAQPTAGKILYLPGVLPYAQRVAIGATRFTHDAEGRGKDTDYSIEFKRLGLGKFMGEPPFFDPTTQPTSTPKGGSARIFTTTAKINTLRQIAKLKLKNANRWEAIYNKNLRLFDRLNIPKPKAPSHHLKVGTKVYW